MLFRLNLFNHEIAVHAATRPMRKTLVQAYTNRCHDGRYVLCLDYDRQPCEWIMQELKRLQQDFALGDFWIFESSKESYHAVCLDKLFYREMLEIMRCTTIDEKYITVPVRFGKRIWSLRYSDKNGSSIRFVGRLRSTTTRQQSLAHALFLEKIFQIPSTWQENADQETKICLSTYKT